MVFNQYTTYRQYPRYLLAFNSPPKKTHVRYQIEKEERKAKGELSLVSQRKLKHAINNLIFISDTQTRFTDTGEKFNFKINFITLNLPAPQFHSDKELKAILNDWLKIWQPKGLRSYVWKAEKQSNGNIHFHLTTNCYIHHSDIRDSWNLVLKRLGYIDKYRDIQKEWHKNGFNYRPELSRKVKGKMQEWTYHQQKEAYERGKKENWSNPNTTDVHGVRKIKDMAAYLCEYMTKNKGDKVEGRIWSCSRNLLFKPHDLELESAIEAHKYLKQPETIHGDFFALIDYKYIINNTIQHELNIFRDRVKESSDYELISPDG